MLDVGWTEILVIAVVLIIVVGPKDLPQMLRTFGRMMTKMRGMASDFRHQFDEALREADLEDVKKTIGDAQKLNPLNTIREAVNPLRQMGNDIRSDLQKATSSVSPTDPEPIAVPAEAPKPAPSEPVAAVPLKAGAVAKTAGKKPSGDGAGKARKASVKADGAAKPAAKAKVAKAGKPAAGAGKAVAARSKVEKSRKDEV